MPDRLQNRNFFRARSPLVVRGCFLRSPFLVRVSRPPYRLARMDTRDPAVFLAVPALLGAVAIAGMVVPAHHAANREPLRVLHEE